MGINLPNGAEVEEIILPDGSQASEVIGPDGSTVWGRNAILDAVTDHWPVSEGSGTVLVNDIGSVDIDITADDWVSDSRFEDGEGYVLDGVDNRWETQSTMPINGQEYSFAAWVWDYNGADDAAPFAWSGGSSIPDNGWMIELTTAGEVIQMRHLNGGETGYIAEDLDLTADGSKSYFIGASGNGDDGNLYVWDTTSQIHSVSGTETRGDIGTDKLLAGGGRTDADRYAEGVFDTPFVSTTDTLTESEFEKLWERTKP